MYATIYKYGTRRCDLSLAEEFVIAHADHEHLNKKTEIISKCHHRNKYLIKNVVLDVLTCLGFIWLN